MPWKASGAKRHTKKAKSQSQKRKWAATANSVLKQSGDEGKAVRIANAIVKRGRKK